MAEHKIELALNGERRSFSVETGETLLHVLREIAGLMGAKKGCNPWTRRLNRESIRTICPCRTWHMPYWFAAPTPTQGCSASTQAKRRRSLVTLTVWRSSRLKMSHIYIGVPNHGGRCGYPRRPCLCCWNISDWGINPLATYVSSVFVHFRRNKLQTNPKTRFYLLSIAREKPAIPCGTTGLSGAVTRIRTGDLILTKKFRAILWGTHPSPRIPPNTLQPKNLHRF